jgi:hypothetical protein
LSGELARGRGNVRPANGSAHPSHLYSHHTIRNVPVLRWEYRPGSTLFFVWQQNRSGGEPYGDFEFGRDTGAIFDARHDNVFVVKATYWLGT